MKHTTGALLIRLKEDEDTSTYLSPMKFAHLPNAFKEALWQMSSPDGEMKHTSWIAPPKALFLRQEPMGDVHFLAAGEINKVEADKRGGYHLNLSEDSLLPDIDREDARLLSVLRLSLPRNLVDRIKYLARFHMRGTASIISERDFRIIRSGEIFQHATIIQAIVDEFNEVLYDKSPLLRIEGRSHEEIWMNALKSAIQMLYEQVAIPTELAYQAALTWKTIRASSNNVAGHSTLSFADERTDQTLEKQQSVNINLQDVTKLREILMSQYLDGEVTCEFIEDIKQAAGNWDYEEIKFMQRFPYPGNLVI